MRFSLANFAARWGQTFVVLSLVYSIACSLVLLTGWGGEGFVDFVGAWGNLPLVVIVTLAILPVVQDSTLSAHRRLAYRLILSALILDFVAGAGWAYGSYTGEMTTGDWPDVLYFFYYPMVAWAFVLLYFDLGGRLSTARSLIDCATLSIGFGSLLWFTALQPLAYLPAGEFAEKWSVAGYGIGNAIALIAGALVAMQITDWRSEKALVWMLVAMVVTLVADLLWVNAELRGDYELGAPGDIPYFAFYVCLLVSVRAMRQRPAPGADTRGLQGDLRGSLPMVALSTGIIALLDDRLGLTSLQAPVLIAVMIIATLLVIASQAIATREVVTLHREVATRRFDERLTELVRRSSDMIAICDTDGVIRYASPSSEQLLGATPGELAGQRLDEVLGSEAAHVRDAFNQVLRAAHSEQTTVFSIPQPRGEKRSFKMVIANLCHVDSIRGITLNIRDVSDAARLNDQLRTLAFHDPLTLLANRSLFSDRVHQAIRHVTDGMTPAVLFIDLDNFKTVNDSMGHGAGDQLLRAFAHRLVQCTRAGDTVARLGGDEFAVLLDHVPNTAAAMAVARQVIEACKQPFDLDGQPARVGASVGVAIADRVSTAERLLRNADAAMYAAKANGKGHAEVFAPEMLRAARRRIRLENELATAIDLKQFEVHYQPIVDLASRHMVGVEALMRWRHPTRGLVMPGDFIPLAEETGQIVPMTEWILDRACADLAQLQDRIESGEGVRMSVNMSSRYLNRGNVVSDIRTALESHRIRPEGLILEVSESLLLDDSSHVEQIFKDLKLLGVRLALDDFGTGYSSLAYLHRFPIDILTIDRSFVQRLVREHDGSEGVDAAALARAILSLAEALGLDTVAEGIELDAQRDKLLELGCKTGQGYAFGKPMPIHEIFDAAVTRRRSVLGGNVSGRADFTATGRFRAI
jgi:diguanylate cyclase (GGDEF)-like protein/PAS domain S-box-containing protein